LGRLRELNWSHRRPKMLELGSDIDEKHKQSCEKNFVFVCLS